MKKKVKTTRGDFHVHLVKVISKALRGKKLSPKLAEKILNPEKYGPVNEHLKKLGFKKKEIKFLAQNIYEWINQREEEFLSQEEVDQMINNSRKNAK